MNLLGQSSRDESCSSLSQLVVESLSYGCLPLVFDTLRYVLQGKSIVVVSPLKALMLDKVQIFIEKSVKATYVGTDDCDGGSTADQMENSIGV